MSGETPEEYLQRLTETIDSEEVYFSALLGRNYIPNPDDEDFETVVPPPPLQRGEYVLSGDRDDGQWRRQCFEPVPCDSCIVRQYQAKPIYVGGSAHGYFVQQDLQYTECIAVPIFRYPEPVFLRESDSAIAESTIRTEYYEKRYIRVIIESSFLRTRDCAIVVWIHTSISGDSVEGFNRFYQFAREGV